MQRALGEVFGVDQSVALKLLGSERSFEPLEVMALKTRATRKTRFLESDCSATNLYCAESHDKSLSSQGTVT